MSIWKRYRGAKVNRGHKDYDKGTWIAEGRIDGQRYKKPLPRETVRTAEQARAADAEIRVQIRSGGFIASKANNRFTDYVDAEYLPYCKVNRKNYAGKMSQCRTLKAFFRNEPLAAITPSRCEQFKRFRLSRKAQCQKCRHNRSHECTPAAVSTSTVNNDLAALKDIFKRARADRKIKENPMEFVPKMPTDPPRRRFLSADERHRLLSSLPRRPQSYAIILTAFLTGWRKGQVLSLRGSDLEGGMVWRPAQKRKPRTLVPVHPLVYETLSRLAEVRDDWLFVNPSGKRLVNFDPVWRKVRTDAGLENLRFHDLRHQFSTELTNNGLTDFAVQHALGHSSPQTTQGYAHVKDEYLIEGLSRLKVDDIPPLDTIFTPSERVM